MKKFILLFLLTPILFAVNDFQVFYLEDSQNQHTIETIQAFDFNQSLPRRFSLGYRAKNHAHWFAIDINATHEEELYLYFTNLFAKDFTFYYQDSDEKWQKKEAGYNESNRSKSIWTSKPTLPFDPKYNKRIYIKIQSDVAIVGEFLLFSSLGSLINYQSHYYLFFALFFGVILMSIVINLFLFVSLREKIYGYYVAHLLFTASFVFMVNSLHSPFATPLIIQVFRMFSPIALIFYILFSKELLEVRRVAPRLNMLFNFILLAMLFFVIMINHATSPWYGLLAKSSTILYLLLLIATIVAIDHKINKAKVYLFAFIAQLITGWMMTSMYSGILENTDINQYGFMVTGIISFMLFTIILANRINEEMQKKLKVEEKLLAEQASYTERLENNVLERTQKINTLLKEKEILLREVYHRVKNNFQMVMSLLWIEHENQKSHQQKSTLLELMNRIKSMSLVHEYLLDLDDYSEIRADEYIERVLMEIKKSYSQKNLDITKTIDDFTLAPDQALYLGILINELLTNSIKHYHQTDTCHIDITCKIHVDEVHMDISDNGKGFDFQKAKRSSFGLQLIKEFTKKLKSRESRFNFEKGTCYHLTFKL